jgi:hypothetical protein
MANTLSLHDALPISGYDFLIASDIVTISGEDVMPTIEEIKKARGQ